MLPYETKPTCENIVKYSKPNITNFKRKDDSIIVCLYEISKVHVEAPIV